MSITVDSFISKNEWMQRVESNYSMTKLTCTPSSFRHNRPPHTPIHHHAAQQSCIQTFCSINHTQRCARLHRPLRNSAISYRNGLQARLRPQSPEWSHALRHPHHTDIGINILLLCQRVARRRAVKAGQGPNHGVCSDEQGGYGVGAQAVSCH